jgi:hypothetical protein
MLSVQCVHHSIKERCVETLPFGSCTLIGTADVVSCKPVASERRRRVCVDPESIQKFPEKAIVLCANAMVILITTVETFVSDET